MHAPRTVSAVLTGIAACGTFAGEPTRLFWGDTHLHTSYSFDAALVNSRVTPAEAYRFARGEPVATAGGEAARLERPLDFLVVADHAEYLGALRLIRAGDPRMLAQPMGKRLAEILAGGSSATVEATNQTMLEIGMSYQTGKPVMELPAGSTSPWSEIVASADAENRPGSFTAFAGFEWSSMPDGDNLHRVVVFADGADKLGEVKPFSAIDSNDPRELWRYLAVYERKTGGRALAIPHNSNVSGGRMFSERDFSGESMTAEYARERRHYEPLVEVTQIKGDSESHPFLSPRDEFADFGTWDAANIAMNRSHENWMYRYEYAREALKTGLAIAARIGVNPYAFGLIGSTDSHTGLSTADDDNFWGKFEGEGPGSDRATESWGVRRLASGETVRIDKWEMLASGYMAVWASANTRAALFDAMRRREVYATTGPRIQLRFFGGWAFEDSDLARPDPAATGYRKGVPMGSCLGDRDEGVRPTFLVWALRDPAGANLDRIQIVKGWTDPTGRTQEKVHDVAWSGERSAGPDGRLAAVGNTVDLRKASYTNTIGAAQLATVWSDPDFDAAQRAFYYVRVLEIPTPRWVAYDRARRGVRLPDAAVQIQQERAYSSPIWFEPLSSEACERADS